MVSGACRERAQEIAKRTRRGGLVIEVGVLVGHLALATHRLRPDLRWIMVDNWLPMDRQPQAYRDTGDDHALQPQSTADRHRAQAHRVAEQVGAQVLDMDSLSAARRFGIGEADLVFIDADHSFEGCRADIEAWRDVPRQWLGGHDYRNSDPRFGGVDRAVSEAFPGGVETGGNYTWWVKC